MSQTIRVSSTWSNVKPTIRPEIFRFNQTFHNLRGLSTQSLRSGHIKGPRQPSVARHTIFQHSSKSPAVDSTYHWSFSTQVRTMSATTDLRDRYKLIFFVPPTDLEACKEAIFVTGAGSFPGGKYTKCCFQTNGTGQFLPSQDANPAIGAVGTLERCEEVKAEIMCLGREVMLNAVQALIKAHPYEEVAYEVYRMENV